MYIEFILILLILVVLYFIFLKDNRILVEAYNGKKYYLVPTKNKKLLKQKADFLADIDINLTKVVKFMKEKEFPNKNSSNLCHKRYSKLRLCETPHNEVAAAYTLNKDTEMAICIISRETGKINNFNDAMFVSLHELAHVMSISTGHGPEFHTNNKHTIQAGLHLKVWMDPRYEKNPTNFCGTDITRSPCSQDSNACTNLNTLFTQL